MAMSDEEKFKKKKELKKQVRKTPKQRQSDARKKDPKFQGGSPNTVFKPEVIKPDPTAEDIQEALQDEDMRQGNFLQSKNLGRNTLKILKTAAALTQFPTTVLRTGLTISGIGGRM